MTKVFWATEKKKGPYLYTEKKKGGKGGRGGDQHHLEVIS